MSKVIKLIFGFLILSFVYFTLKWLGVFGRQYGAETLAINDFELSSESKTFELEIPSKKRGIYLYNILIMDMKENGKEQLYYSRHGSLNLGTQILGKNTHNVYLTENITITYKNDDRNLPSYATSGLKWGGNEFRTRAFSKDDNFILKVTVNKYNLDASAKVNLRLFVRNTRPCWFIECLLD